MSVGCEAEAAGKTRKATGMQASEWHNRKRRQGAKGRKNGEAVSHSGETGIKSNKQINRVCESASGLTWTRGGCAASLSLELKLKAPAAWVWS
jgi:hypothetical protein